MENEKFYTSQEIADRLGLKLGTIQKYVREGKLNAVRLGGSRKIIRVSESELRRFTETLKN